MNSSVGLYIALIVVTIIFIILYLVIDAYFVYRNVGRVSSAVERLEPQVDRAAEVICDPILQRRAESLGFGIKIEFSTPEARNLCSQLIVDR